MTTLIHTAPTRPKVPNCRDLPLFETCLIDYWVHDVAPAVQALVSSIHTAQRKEGAAERGRTTVMHAVYSLCRKLEAGGLYQPQSAKNGLRVELDQTAGNAVHWLNLSAVPVADATFALVAREYLVATTDDGVTDAERARFRTAMRLLLGLPMQCGDSVIITAAERLPIAEVINLPNRVMDLALAAGQKRQSAQNLRTAVRGAMRFAAERRACPIVFRAAPLANDEWVALMNTHFPLAQTGPSSQTILSLRKGVKILAVAAADAHEKEYLDHLVTPGSITREDGDAIIKYIRTRLGKEYDARQARYALKKLTAAGAGKLGGPSPLARFEVQTAHGMQPAIYLRDAEGRAGANNWGKMLEIVAGAGLPKATVELLDWYGKWVTLPPEAFLEANCPWPSVLNRHLLSRSSLDSRSTDIRAWIGCAINILGMEPATLTPSRLFGELFDQIGKAVIAWWRERQAALRAVGKKSGSATKGSLHHIIVSAGIVAYAGYVQARHQRGFVAEIIESEDGGRIDVLSESMAEKTPAEDRFLRGYSTSLQRAATIKRLVSAKGRRGRKSVKDESGMNRPEFKDIRKIIQFTPPAWWISLLDWLHDQVREAIRNGKDEGAEFHSLVQHAWELGVLISTGFRGEELCRLERGVHIKDGSGRVSIEAGERKNVKAQSADMQPRYVPPDIHELYLERTLPWLCRGQYEEMAVRHEQRHRRNWQHAAEAARGRAHYHEFLVVNTNGAAPGAILANEPAAGAKRVLSADDSDRKFKDAVAAHGSRWRAAMMRRAIQAGLKLPDELEFSFGRHCIRGAFGYALYQTQGEVASANYLGDSTETVRLAYTAIDGINVDVSLVADFVVPNRGIQLKRDEATATNSGSTRSNRASAAAPGDRGTSDRRQYLEREAELRADLREGLITPERYRELDSEYRALYLGEDRVRIAS